MKKIDRRQLLHRSLFGCGALGLKSMLLGLPTSFLSRRVLAAPGEQTHLIYSFDVEGGSINISCPGSYIGGNTIVRPPEFKQAVKFKLGSVSVEAASPWATMNEAVRERLHFIHHQTEVTAHSEGPGVLTGSAAIQGASGVGSEMFPSAIAQMLNLQVTSAAPIQLGGKWTFTNNSIAVNRQKTTIVADNFKKMSNSEKDLVNLRDKALDQLYKDLCKTGNSSQKSFCDDFLLSRNQARDLSESLGEIIEQIEIDDSHRSSLSLAAALIAANATRVVCVEIPFGGDNHSDVEWEAEIAGLKTGTADLSFLWEQMKKLGVEEKTTVVLQGIFGRTFGQKEKSGAPMAGRDHHKNSATLAVYGPHVKPGVSGGIKATEGQKGAFSTGIDSQTGASSDKGDIKPEESLASVYKTIASACGIDQETVNKRFVSGKVIKSAVSS